MNLIMFCTITLWLLMQMSLEHRTGVVTRWVIKKCIPKYLYIATNTHISDLKESVNYAKFSSFSQNIAFNLYRNKSIVRSNFL